MKTDAEIRADVASELRWDPRVESAGIAVAVRDGIVTLSGSVARCCDQAAAAEVAERVAGVRAVANELEVNIPIAGRRTDAEIAAAVANALSWNAALGEHAVRPVVRGGWVRLEGEVAHAHERAAAESMVRQFKGVRGVSNEIKIRRSAASVGVKRWIEEALRRQASLGGAAVEVAIAGGSVVLTGQVGSQRGLDDAARAAWSAPGVTRVESRLTVRR